MTNPTPARRPRRWWKVLATVLVVVLVVVVALPWALTLGPARSRVASGLNQALAPGRFQFEELHLAWFGPTRLSNVTLLDPKGEVVGKAPSAVYDQSLFQILFGFREPSNLTFDGASLEVERDSDGSVNLAQALQTIIASPDPKRDVTIRIARGSLRYRDPFLAEPSTADSVDLTLRLPFAPNPVTWSLKLGQGNSNLEVQGEFDRWLSRGGPPRTPELQVGVVGKRWPFVAKTAGVDATGRFDGSLDFARKRGRWVLSGDAKLTGLNARGKALSGDTLAFDRLEAGYDLSEGEEGWTIRRLSVTSPLGEIKAEGQLGGPDGTGKQRIEGRVDLAEIARQLPHALRLREGLAVDRGSARIAVDLTSSTGRSTYDIEARLTDFAARDHDRPLALREPATLTARLIRDGDVASVERLAVKTSFLDLSAQGKLDDGVKLAGTIDLGGLRKQLGEWVDLGQLELSGRAEVAGTYEVRSLAARGFPAEKNAGVRAIEGGGPSFDGRISVDLHDLRIEGLGLPSIRRATATCSASVIGMGDASGWPLAWELADLKAEAEGTGISAKLVNGPQPWSPQARARTARGKEGRAEPINFNISAGTILALRGDQKRPVSTPFDVIMGRSEPEAAVGDRNRLIQSSIEGSWSPDAERLTLNRVLISLASGRRLRPVDRLEVSAKGHFDLRTGELLLEPAAEGPNQTLSINPEGLRISGLGQGLSALRFDGGISGNVGGLDGLIADMTDRSPLGLDGRWSANATARGDGEGLQIAGKVTVLDPSNPDPKPNRPNSIAVRAQYSSKLDRLEFSEFTASTAYGVIDASGKVDDLNSGRRVELTGKLAPDFAAINALLVQKVEPGAKVEGKASTFRASGALGESLEGWKQLDAELGFDLTSADVYGMKFGPSPVVLRSRNGKLSFDPISTTLNEGHIRLEPEVDLDAPGGPILRLAKNSTIREARINDEVSKRVLSYVAPVLDQATRASGLVSVDLDHAEFPLGPGRGRQAKVEGAVVFQNVEFAPGPLAAEILGAIGRGDLSLKLDQPVTLTIADGRVNQRGMAIPIGDFTRIEMAGWVDFDRNLAITATVPVTPAMLGNNPLLSDIASGTKVRLPIKGTLDRPKIDQEAFSANLQDLGKSLLTRGATRGAIELLMRMTRPKDPDAPPPPPRMTPQERRTQRQEKKAAGRGEDPPR
jgi:translocation and assembly module TamB